MNGNGRDGNWNLRSDSRSCALVVPAFVLCCFASTVPRLRTALNDYTIAYSASRSTDCGLEPRVPAGVWNISHLDPPLLGHFLWLLNRYRLANHIRLGLRMVG